MLAFDLSALFFASEQLDIYTEALEAREVRDSTATHHGCNKVPKRRKHGRPGKMSYTGPMLLKCHPNSSPSTFSAILQGKNCLGNHDAKMDPWCREHGWRARNRHFASKMAGFKPHFSPYLGRVRVGETMAPPVSPTWLPQRRPTIKISAPISRQVYSNHQ